MSQPHDDVPVRREERCIQPSPIGSLLRTVAEAVEQYQQASVEQLHAVQLAAQRASDARVAELADRVGTLDQRTAALVGWADGLDDRLSQVATRQAELMGRLADAEARLERLSGHVVGLAERAERHEVAVDERLAMLTGRADSLRRGEEALTAHVASLAADLGAGERARSALAEDITALSKQVEGVSAEHIRGLDEQLTATVGEATLARIELERLSQRVGERFDTMQVQVGELEAQMAEQMDVSVAVQLERLDELERAVIELDPESLVRKG